MIFRLALAQARAQKRYTLWTASLLSVALAFVTIGLLLQTTQQQMLDDFGRLQLAGRDHGVWGVQYFGDFPEDSFYAPGDVHSVGEVDDHIAQAIANGSDVAAIRQWGVVSRPVAEFPQLSLAAATGAYDWDLILAEGALPGDGEILLNARVAAHLDLGIGDTIDLLYRLHLPTTDEPATEADWHTYTVSGLSKACHVDHPLLAETWLCPDFSFVSWETSSDIDGPLTCRECPVNEAGDSASVIANAGIAWNIDDPALAMFAAAARDQEASEGFVTYINGMYHASTPGIAQLGFLLAGLVAFGVLLGAFAVGRAQAQSRVHWVATARTLGATRRTVVAAALLETAIVAVGAALAALVVTYGIVALALRFMRSFDGPAIGPSGVVMPWWVAGAVLASGAVLSLVIGAVPAFWASRVSPVAAFAPVNDVTDVEASRRVSQWWIVPPFAAGLAAMWIGSRNAASLDGLVPIGVFIAAVSGFILLRDGLREVVVRTGGRLSRARSTVLQVAGTAFSSAPRSAVTSALLCAIPVAFLTWVMVLANFSNRSAYLDSGDGGYNWPLSDGGVGGFWGSELVLWALVIAVECELVALAVTFAFRRAEATDAATRRALGLSTIQQRQVAFIRHVVPAVGGAALGAGISVVVGIAGFVLDGSGDPRHNELGLGAYLPAVKYAAMNAGFLVLFVTAFVSIGGLIVAASASRVRPPVEALRPVGRGHSK